MAFFSLLNMFLFLKISLIILVQYVLTEDYVTQIYTENTSDANISFVDILKNDSGEMVYLNQNNEVMNLTNDSYLALIPEEANSTHPNGIVTEDWRNLPRHEWDQKNFALAAPDEDVCSCDLTANSCDINCCCDPDCDKEDVRVFSTCLSQQRTFDSNYCYQEDIVLRNSTMYKMQRDPHSSLFCIVHDNLKQHLRFKDLPVLKSHRDLDTLLQYQSKKIYSWKLEPQDTQDIHSHEIRVGSPIYITHDSSAERKWALPSSCFTHMCSCDQEVKYLEHFSSTCSRNIHLSKSECETNPALSAHTFSGFCLQPRGLSLAIQDLVSHTVTLNDPESLSCAKTDCPRPEYRDGECRNVVRSVRYTLKHSGVRGIDGLQVAFTLVNVSSASFVQTFDVAFRWSNDSEGATTPRSGHPGYRIGLPILVGTNHSATEPEDGVEVQSSPLSVFERNSDGTCSARRRTLGFGKNFRSSCVWRISSPNCTRLKQEVTDLLLGLTGRHVFVGVFGNANESNPDDWIEAYHEPSDTSNKSCSVTPALHVKVVHAAVGSTANPQFKILGLGYHYGRPQYVDSSLSHLLVTASVSFFDVTEPATAHYPKVPSLKTHLPSDFFYPFLNACCRPETTLLVLVLVFVVSILQEMSVCDLVL